MRSSKRRLILDTGLIGVAVTLVVLALDFSGRLSGLENAAYDARVRHAQWSPPPRRDQFVHIDIDDAALEEIGRWPWNRDKIARILNELRLAQPKVISLDTFFSEPERPRSEPGIDGAPQNIVPDQILADTIRRCGNVQVPMHVSLDQPPASSPLRDSLIKILTRDLELAPDQLVKAAQDLGANADDLPAQVAHEYPFALKEALFRRVDAELGMSATAYSATTDELRGPLLPRSQATGVRTYADHALEKVLPQVLAIRAMERLTCVPPDGLPPLLSSDQGEATIPLLEQAASYSGYVDYLPFFDGVVRSVPLFVKYRGRLVPQSGFALAVAYLGADIRSVRIEPDRVIIPLQGASDVVIPVHMVQTDSRGPLGLFMDIPWFGANDWKTMYDYPDYRQTRQHVPITEVWDICQLGEQIEWNDYAAATDVELVLAKNDAEKLRAFQASRPAFDDVDGWNKAMSSALAAVSDLTKQAYGQKLDADAPIDLSQFTDQDERQYVSAMRKLSLRPRRNQQMVEERRRLRQSMADRLRGRAVLIGWTSSGETDFFATPLHVACPGAVIHGVIFNGIVTGDLWSRLPSWMTALTTLALGLMTTAAVARLSPWTALSVSAALGGGFLLANFAVLFDHYHTIMGVAGPMCAIAGVWSLCSLSRFLTINSEKAWITKQFCSYVDPSLVHYLFEHPEEAGFKGIERELTVVFTDLAGFTSLSERLKRRTVPLLNEYLGLMEPVIRAHHGLVNKFLGDGIMFFFGAPAPYPGDGRGHAAAAVDTVFAMQARLLEFNATLAALDLPPMAMRAGICTGAMVVGNAGSAVRSDYTVLGDRVNFASRLESANKATGTLVLLSERTVDLAADLYLVRKIGRLQVAGKQDSDMAYEPLALAAQATDAQRRLARQTERVVDAFIQGDFQRCLMELQALEAEFGPSQSTFCGLYRNLCTEYLGQPPKLFSGQICLEHD
jgi:class 3 adenylate cyclase/CHASE2 domain-containing sensor protein